MIRNHLSVTMYDSKKHQSTTTNELDQILNDETTLSDKKKPEQSNKVHHKSNASNVGLLPPLYAVNTTMAQRTSIATEFPYQEFKGFGETEENDASVDAVIRKNQVA